MANKCKYMGHDMKIVWCPSDKANSQYARDSWHSFSKRKSKVAAVIAPSFIGDPIKRSRFVIWLFCTGKVQDGTDVLYFTAQPQILTGSDQSINVVETILNKSSRSYVLYDETRQYDALIDARTFTTDSQQLAVYCGEIDALPADVVDTMKTIKTFHSVLRMWNVLTECNDRQFDAHIAQSGSLQEAWARMEKWFSILCGERVTFPITLDDLAAARQYMSKRKERNAESRVIDYGGDDMVKLIDMQAVFPSSFDDPSFDDHVSKLEEAATLAGNLITLAEFYMTQANLPMHFSFPNSAFGEILPDMDKKIMTRLFEELGVYDALDAHFTHGIPMSDFLVGGKPRGEMQG